MGTLDPRKLIEMNINHMNNFHIKISRITVFNLILGDTHAHVPHAAYISIGRLNIYLKQLRSYHVKSDCNYNSWLVA